MSTVSEALSILDLASQKTTSFITAEARYYAEDSGWPNHLVNDLAADYGDAGFNVRVNPENHNDGFVAEFGDEGVPPTAAMRRMANRPTNAESALVSNINDLVGGLL